MKELSPKQREHFEDLACAYLDSKVAPISGFISDEDRDGEHWYMIEQLIGEEWEKEA